MAAVTDKATIARRHLGRMVTHLIGVVPDFLPENVPNDDEGNRVIVPALLEDTIHNVTAQVHRSGGAALVVMLEENAKDGLTIHMANLIIDHDDDCDIPVGQDTTMADLMKIMTPGVSITYRIDHVELSVGPATAVPNPELVGT